MALGALLEEVAESATTWHSLVERQHGASRVNFLQESFGIMKY